ncbi:MAG TPA: NADH:ubiquinone oxidoreductase [candidate division WOR-3 bacterium]|uniref:NADH:ubiquinone oxidoreductase n=1 Tax=candidate division WOR-3 bacterium TaxID=2052148 RepID=A0A7V0Q5Q0_UNCW3|nr:NADH:ubiquinone oxidoreductase [Candidatus Hydrothermae bacterium]HDL60234.1 NADH:ubiquinone oxidoreductase [candidate division WOR-3 bacterium]
MKPKIGIYGLTGCAGDQLNILNCEDELLKLFDIFEIKSFVMASRAADESVELDVAFVEGSVSTAKDLEDLLAIRKKSKILVAIGHCAIYGGVQAMFMGKEEWIERYQKVYGKQDAVTLTAPLEPKPLSAYVKVDAALPGCPIEKEPFLKLAGMLIHGVVPKNPDYPVCAECRWKENECLLLKGEICLGPLTNSGCGAICPSHNTGCIGCWGPIAEENYAAEIKLLIDKGYDLDAVIKRFSIFGGTERAEKLRKFLEKEGRK